MATSVYLYDLVVGDVAATLGVTIDASATPNATATTAKIKGLCADVNSELENVGVTPADVTEANDANLYEKIRARIIDEAGGWWNARNERDEEASEDRAEAWAAFLVDIRTKATRALGASAPTKGASTHTKAGTTPTPKWNRTTSFQ